MSHKLKILQGSASNLLKLMLSMLVALVLPPLLVHRMSPPEYSAWVLILQCSAYVSVLDLGLQTAIGKYVAEYDAIGDLTASSRILSSSFAILCASAFVGAVAIAVITWRVPQLFRQMPPDLTGDLRLGILLVGMSAVVALPFSSFLATFIGLQKYWFPTALAMGSKILTSSVLIVLLLMGGKLKQLAFAMAFFTLVTALGQFVGWSKYVSERVDFSFRLIDRKFALRLAKYCGILSIWTVAALFVSGLDMVIVGHYDYKNTGYYGIATSATNFMLLIVGSLFSPLLPAVSSLQTARTPSEIGSLTIKVTRYCMILMCLIALPLLLGAYPVLKLWVGHNYAIHSELFLEVLVLGNVIRTIGYPYSLVVVATGKQHLATIAAVAEAALNVTLSIYLVQRVGAVGVAIGTLAGAFVSVGVHLAVSMKLTRSTILISRRTFLLEGLLRPLLCVIPSALLSPFWRRFVMLPMSPSLIALWAGSTLATAWLVGLTSTERREIKQAVLRFLNLHPSSLYPI